MSNIIPTDFLSSPDFIASTAVMIPLVVEFLKKKVLTNTDPRIIVGAICGVIGLVYALSESFVPKEVINNFLQTGGIAFGIATALYKLAK